MFGLAVVLFFSVTGITLNHPDWTFGEAERRVDDEGRMNLRWLHRDGSEDVARLEVVEHLRTTHGVRGAMSEFRTDERECLVTFRGPGYSADAIIDRESGRYSLSQSYHGFIAVVNDLHKGRDTGKAWSLVIDLSAVLITLISLTGLALLFYLKLRRKPGLVVTLIGALAVVMAYLVWVP
jgi:hypothetical protein